jgi:dephospho-CoA kinase
LVTAEIRRIRVVGLTGGIGAGKSAAAAFFAEHGVPLVDTDRIAHQLTAGNGQALSAIKAAFGSDYFDVDGAMHRPRMRARVFSDAAAKATLEAILHPLVLAEARKALDAIPITQGNAPHYALLAVPLLFERMSFRHLLWRTLVIDCPTSIQRQRVQRRSGWSEAEVESVILSQIPRPIRLQLADDVIVNSTDLAALRIGVEQCHLQYSKSVST